MLFLENPKNFGKTKKNGTFKKHLYQFWNENKILIFWTFFKKNILKLWIFLKNWVFLIIWTVLNFFEFMKKGERKINLKGNKTKETGKKKRKKWKKKNRNITQNKKTVQSSLDGLCEFVTIMEWELRFVVPNSFSKWSVF